MGNIVSCGLAGGWYGNKHLYVVKSGTSMATPMVSGAIALLLSVYPKLTPKEIKENDKSSKRNLFLQCILCTMACLISSNYEKFHGFSSYILIGQ